MIKKTQVVKTVGVTLVDMETGKSYDFIKVKDSDAFLDRPHGYTTSSMRRDMMATDRVGKKYKIIPGEVKKIEVEVTERGTQLCWNCRNAVGGCSWSDGRFLPIEGWVATPSSIPMSMKNATQTYAIKECPQFIHD